MVERRNVQLIIILRQQQHGEVERCSGNIILKQQDDGRKEKCSVNNHLEIAAAW